MQIEFYNVSNSEAYNDTLRRQEKITCIRTLLLHFPCQPHLYNVTWLQLIISTLVSTILIKETCYISMHQSLHVMELFWKKKKNKKERNKEKKKKHRSTFYPIFRVKIRLNACNLQMVKRFLNLPLDSKSN